MFGPITSVAVMSNDNIVIGVNNTSNGQIFVRDPVSLAPATGTPPGGTVFGPVFDVDVLSNDSIVVGVNNGTNGQVFVRDPISLLPATGTEPTGTLLGPVTAVKTPSGISTSIPRRLCSRAPRTFRKFSNGLPLLPYTGRRDGGMGII